MVFTCFTLPSIEVSAAGSRQMEYLNRGAIAVKTSNGVYLSWRLLGTEPMSTTFNIYQNGEKIVSELNNTNYTCIGGSANASYRIAPVINGEEGMISDDAKMITSYADVPYIDIPLDIPAGGTVPKVGSEGTNSYTYSANDCSVGDLDGDGEYEIILKWDPSNSKDNAGSGYTGNVLLDAYKLDGTKLWRIDLGVNIRAGAHYTQFMVYDFDGDGKAEVAVKTAPGSIDGAGEYVTAAGNTSTIRSADNSKDYRNSSGHIVSGPEYLTIFNGPSGAAMQTIDYEPNYSVCSWGDSKGNRGNRFLACVAYLDGVTPSLVMCRGYYTNAYLAAYTWDGQNLKKQWLHASEKNSSKVTYADRTTKTSSVTIYGQGSHSVEVADIDGDGCDEIVYGASALDHDGTALYNTKWGHGDALHISDYDNDGDLEIFQPYEDIYAFAMRDAKTGKAIYRNTAQNGDVGRGIAFRGGSAHKYLMWVSGTEKGATLTNSENAQIVPAGTANGAHSTNIKTSYTANFTIYWDGDLYEELFERSYVYKWNDDKFNFDRLWTIYQKNSIGTNNSTKYNACLVADILGDWREELVMRLDDNSALRVFTTNIPTDYKLTTLMHDSQYRTSVAVENVAYNQPAHTSYYISEDMNYSALKSPNIHFAVSPAEVRFNITDESGQAVENAKIKLNGMNFYTNADGKVSVTLLEGSYSYSIKASGKKKVSDEIEIASGDELKEINITLTDSSTTELSVVKRTADGIQLSDEETLGEFVPGSEFSLAEEHKADILFGGTVYEYDVNMSGATAFTVDDPNVEFIDEDDVITLIFKEKAVPSVDDIDIYSTNFSRDGYAADSAQHGYTTALTPEYGVMGGEKYGKYTVGGDGTISIDLGGSYSNFVVEFDMAYDGYDAASGGDIIGLTLYSGNKQGSTAGIRYTGGMVVNASLFSGSSANYYGGTVPTGQMMHYILSSDGETLSMRVFNKATGASIYETSMTSFRNGVGTASSPVDKLIFRNGNGSSAVNFSLGSLKVYQVGGATDSVWNSPAVVGIPSSTDFAPSVFAHRTDMDGVMFDLKSGIEYAVYDKDGNPADGISLNGSTVVVAESAPKAEYTITASYNGKTVSTSSFRTAEAKKGTFYNSNTHGTLSEFSYGGGLNGGVSYKEDTTVGSKAWILSLEGATGGREMYRDFFPTSEEVTMSFVFNTGGKKDANNAWNWANRAYEYEIQFLDGDYDSALNATNILNGGEDNSGDNVLLAITQEYLEGGSQEAKYYTKSKSKTEVKSGKASGEPNITKRSSTTWYITVTFNFASQTATMKFMDGNNHESGYTISNIPISGNSFKTLRVVGKKNGEYITWGPTISNLEITRTAYSPGEIGEIDISSSGSSAVVSFDTPTDNGGAPITKYIITPYKDGTALPSIESTTNPAVIPNMEVGSYAFTVQPVNAVGSGNVSAVSGAVQFNEVNINQNIEKGTVTADGSVAGAGSQVFLNITPDEGCELAELIVTDADGNLIDFDEIQSYFVMPSSSVSIDARFVKPFSVENVTSSQGGGTLTVDADLISEYAEPLDTLIAAVYSGERLVGAKRLDVSVEPYETVHQTLTFDCETAENLTLSIFVWNSVEKMNPVLNPVNIKLSQQ